MRFLDLWAAVTRNWHLRDFWLRATARGFDEAARDPDFGRVSGAAFGGLNLRPLAVVEQIWSRIFAYVAREGPRAFTDIATGRSGGGFGGDLRAWERGWTRSFTDDPRWHLSWLADVAQKAVHVQSTLWAAENPRVRGHVA
jgi:hypothetical protein